MVVGMLWEVTDLEVDKVISTLLSLFVPSEAPVAWANVGKAKWSHGVLGKIYITISYRKLLVRRSSISPEPGSHPNCL